MAQDSSSPTTAGSNPLLVLVYWAIVAVPLGWGVYKTVQKSIPLFGGTVPAAMSTPTPQASAMPAASTPARSAESPAAVAPAPEAAPFSTAQPSATIPPVVAPTPPTT